MLVGVHAVERVDVLVERHEEAVVVEQARGLREQVVAGDAREAREGLVHAAVLAGDVDVPHLDELGVRQAGEALVRPGADAAREVERLVDPGELEEVE